MGEFDIILIYHSILERCVHALVSEQMLNLLNRHAFINRHCSQCATEFLRMNLWYVQFPANLTKTDLNTTDLKSVIWRN